METWREFFIDFFKGEILEPPYFSSDCDKSVEIAAAELELFVWTKEKVYIIADFYDGDGWRIIIAPRNP